jgi:hypothetical protein
LPARHVLRGAKTSKTDVDRFLGESPAVVAFESGWLDRVRNVRLYCYRLPEAGFRCVDNCAGYYHCDEPVVPDGVDVIDDALAALVAHGVEVRIVPSLWPLHDAVIASTLSYSIIRTRNAAPRVG